MYDPVWTAFTYISAFILLYVNVIYIALLIRFRKLVHWSPEPVPDEDLPKISVVIPAYNESENIRASIESVLASDYPKDKLEVIVVDDGSTDDTYDIAREYTKYDVKVYRKPNGGAADAKNYGAERSTGEFIATLDSDSRVDTQAFRRLIAYFREKNVAAVTGAVRVYDPKKLIEKVQAIEYDIILVLRRLIMGVESVYVTPGGLSMFRRGPFFEVGGFNKNSLTEDQEIAINLQRHGYKIRASLDAFSYTVVPDTLFKLIKQRVRWLRGGIWNRIYHRRLYSPKYGDFVFFGMMFDFVYSIPLLIFAIGILRNVLYNGLWTERLGYLSSLLLSIDPLMLTTIVVLIIGIPYTAYLVNVLRSRAGEKRVGMKDIVPFISYVFFYGYIWVAVWIITFWQELRGGGYIWGTR